MLDDKIMINMDIMIIRLLKIKWLRRLSIGILLSIVVAVTIYFEEKFKDTSDIFIAYGDVSTKLLYTFPEEIKHYSFGRNQGYTPSMEFSNLLMCRQIDSTDEFVLISESGKAEGGPPLENFDLWNEINPARLSRYADETGNMRFLFSQSLQNQIRETGDDQYGSWSANQSKPFESSECQMKTIAETRTFFFGISKYTATMGNTFEYIYE